jgi:NifU-like protein involved in Fe-S cluster formation
MQAVEMSSIAQDRLRRPRTRGAFQSIDAARRQLGLLSVADDAGQARCYWLIDLESKTIADARFIAFGALSSHPVADAFTELVRGRTMDDACALRAEQVESLLRDDPATPAFGAQGIAPLAFVRELQDKALVALPDVKLLPKPEEKVAYQRKRKQDWTPEDERWFPLSLLRKISRIDGVAGRVLRERLGSATVAIDGLHDDFRVVMTFKGLEAEQVPTAAQLVQDALRGEVHSQLVVEGKPA